MQRDYAWHSARHARASWKMPEAIGRARRRAGGGPAQSGQCPKPGQDAGAVRSARRRHFARPFRRGDQRIGSVARKASFLQDKLGSQVFAKGVTIHDDPLRKRGLRVAGRSTARACRSGRWTWSQTAC